MPEIPPEAVMAAATAIERELLSGRDYSMAQDSDEALARVALEAAAPILAEAWGLIAPQPRRPSLLLSVPCPSCGAAPGEQCHAAAVRTSRPRRYYPAGDSHTGRRDAMVAAIERGDLRREVSGGH